MLNPVPVITAPAAFKKSPLASVFIVKYSPPAAPIIVIPTEGLKAFTPPRLEVPVKNGFPKVTFNPDEEVPEDNGAVDVPDPLT